MEFKIDAARGGRLPVEFTVGGDHALGKHERLPILASDFAVGVRNAVNLKHSLTPRAAFGFEVVIKDADGSDLLGELEAFVGVADGFVSGGKLAGAFFDALLERIFGFGELLLNADPFGDVTDGAGDEESFRSGERAETDLNGKFGAVLADTEELQADSHRTRVRRDQVAAAIFDVLGAIIGWNENLDGFSDELLAGIAKEDFRLGVDHLNQTHRIGDDDGIGSRLEKAAEFLFLLLSEGDVAVAFEHGDRLAGKRRTQGPAAGDDAFGAVTACVDELALP